MFVIEVCCIVVCGDFDCCELCVGMWLVWVLWDGILYSLYDGIGFLFLTFTFVAALMSSSALLIVYGRLHLCY